MIVGWNSSLFVNCGKATWVSAFQVFPLLVEFLKKRSHWKGLLTSLVGSSLDQYDQRTPERSWTIEGYMSMFVVFVKIAALLHAVPFHTLSHSCWFPLTFDSNNNQTLPLA